MPPPPQKNIQPPHTHSIPFTHIHTGCTPLYVQPTYDPLLGCAHAVTASDIQAALQQAAHAGHHVGAVLLVSPTYYGVMSDVLSIGKVVHAHGVVLIVDEAHGGHLGRHPELPMVCERCFV